MAKNLELVKFGVDFIKAWQIWFFGARVCGLYFFWRVAKVWRARRADLVCVRGEIKEQGDLACGGWRG